MLRLLKICFQIFLHLQMVMQDHLYIFLIVYKLFYVSGDSFYSSRLWNLFQQFLIIICVNGILVTSKKVGLKKNLFCIFVYDLFVWVLIRLRLINQSNECHDKQRKFPQETHKRWYHSLAINLCVWKISGILKAFMILFSINLFMLSRLF